MTDLSIDIETLGRAPTSAPLSIGWARFDRLATIGKIIDSGLIHVNLDSCLALGLTIDGPTLQWWMGQSEKARAALFAPPGQRPDSLQVALLKLDEIVEGHFRPDGVRERCEKIWTKGPNFDAAILENAYFKLASAGLLRLRHSAPWRYNDSRDVRTIMMAARITDAGRPENSHNAWEDAVAQAVIVQDAFARLRGAGVDFS